jgi:hypothetical protein
MIAKAKASTRKRRASQPVDIRLTVSFRFGDEPGDLVTVMDDRRIPLVGTLFDSRDAILRGFLGLMFKASLKQPKVLAEVVPALKLLQAQRTGKREKNSRGSKPE